MINRNFSAEDIVPPHSADPTEKKQDFLDLMLILPGASFLAQR